MTAKDKRPTKEMIAEGILAMLEKDKEWLWRSIKRKQLFADDDCPLAKALVDKTLSVREGESWLIQQSLHARKLCDSLIRTICSNCLATNLASETKTSSDLMQLLCNAFS